ncbi:MAG: CDP-alcohol phosphatidyltransferase family protein, partial [Deltaproteobacteria bacterium]|nr:CDP-alcohol phosphatidyltransferase family protein [Deltaproteobacteria bacterium]
MSFKYFIPNAITSGGLFLGLLSVFSATNGDLSGAAWLILLCVIIDKCDGIAARALSADSKFGIEMDSFSDFVTFGIAPGVLYLSLFNELYEPLSFPFFASHFAVVVFVLCSSYRLARFNSVSSEKTDYFTGFPTTFCGGVTSSFFLTMEKQGWDGAIPYLPAAK